MLVAVFHSLHFQAFRGEGQHLDERNSRAVPRVDRMVKFLSKSLHLCVRIINAIKSYPIVHMMSLFHAQQTNANFSFYNGKYFRIFLRDYLRSRLIKTFTLSQFRGFSDCLLSASSFEDLPPESTEQRLQMKRSDFEQKYPIGSEQEILLIRKDSFI